MGAVTHARRAVPRGVVLVAMLAIVGFMATACITDGSWSATSPAPIANTQYEPELRSVSCPTTTFCLAVGASSDFPNGVDKTTAVAETWDGTAWTDISATFDLFGSDGADLESAACASSTACVVVYRYWTDGSNYTRVAAWDGSSWAKLPIDVDQLSPTPVSCTPGGSCFVAAGSTGGLWAYDGTNRWQVSSYAPEISGLDCLSAAMCWGISGFGTADRWDGSTWSEILLPAPPGAPALAPRFSGSSIECSTSWWCVAVGNITTNDGQSVPASVRWNGSGWSYATIPVAGPSLLSISCRNGAECVVVGATITATYPYLGSQVAAVWNGSTWSAIANPAADDHLFLSVGCPPVDGTCMAVGGIPASASSVLLASRYSWPPGI